MKRRSFIKRGTAAISSFGLSNNYFTNLDLKKRYGLTIPVLTIDNIEIETRPVNHNHIRKILKL